MKTVLSLVEGIFAVVLALAILSGGTAWAEEGTTASRDGVTGWVAAARFSGDLAGFQKGPWRQAAPDAIGKAGGGFPVLATPSLVLAFDPGQETLEVYTRRGDKTVHRAAVRLPVKTPPGRARIAVPQKGPGLAIEVLGGAEKAACRVTPRASGAIELEGLDGPVEVACRMSYAIVPSLVGTDLVYNPEDAGAGKPVRAASLSLLVGLLEGEGGMMVATWPGTPAAGPELSVGGTPAVFERVRLAGRCKLFLAFIDHSNLWHVEALRPEYLEKDTAIGWKRPFEAKWIGRFHVESDQYDYPFYFRYQKAKLWGRYIAGWFHYPFWFDGQKTLVHFEKKFPPKGKLLIYYLEAEQGKTPVPSPVGIMEEALGRDEARKLLDVEGVQGRLLLKHGNAVCAMTRKIEEIVAKGEGAKRQAEIASWADDVATFIRLIRERVFEFRDYAAEAKKAVAAWKQSHADRADAVQAIEDLLDDMEQTVRDGLPKTSLDEVRKWTDEIKTAAGSENGASLKVKGLDHLCRSVAGTQDDLCRELSILAIRVMEESARMGAGSEEEAALAGDLIARSRAVLRRPTWWEPVRQYEPKSDPGAP